MLYPSSAGRVRTDTKAITVKRDRPVLRQIAALVAVLGLALASCGEDDGGAITDPDEPAAGDDAGDDDTADDDTAGGHDTAGHDAVEVALHDYAFVGLPETVPAGTQFTVVNESEEEAHEFAAFRLEDDEERSVAELAELPPEELGQTLGEPVTVLVAGPGGPMMQAVGDGTVEEPGRYAVVCFIPTGADPEEFLDASAEGPPETEGGPPHVAQGMYGEFTVE